MAAPDSAHALSRLRDMLAQFDAGTRKRGQAYFQSGAVIEIGLDENVVTAEVAGSEVYTTTLHWEDEGWTPVCICPVESYCKHTYAAGLAWLKVCGETPAERAASARIVPFAQSVPAAATATAAKKKHTFREEWTPLLAEKLGRPLTDAEGRQLGQLSALFNTLRTGWGFRVHVSAIEHHGFLVSRDATSSYGIAYEGWWDERHPPATPWALWQFIAYDYERHNWPIPAAFAPMTDTASVRAAIEHRLTQQELEPWRHALHQLAIGADDAGSRSELRAVVDVRLRLVPGNGFMIETRAAEGKPWKPPATKWISALHESTPADFLHLPPPAAALALSLAAECRGYNRELSPKLCVPPRSLSRVLAYPATHDAIVLPDDGPWRVEAEPLVLQAVPAHGQRNRLELQLVTPDGRDASGAMPLTTGRSPYYEVNGRIFRGPPPPPAPSLPAAALADPALLSSLRRIGLRLPASLEVRFQRIELRPVLRCWLSDDVAPGGSEFFHVQLLARSETPPCTQVWNGAGNWHWLEGATPPARGPDDPVLEFDLTAASAMVAHLANFKVYWNPWNQSASRYVTKHFPDDFAAWRATLPPDVVIEAQGALAGLLAAPLKARVDFSAIPTADNPRDWFDLSVELKVEDTTLTPDEIALLLKARGKWVRLPRAGWRRLELETGGEAAGVLARLGVHAEAALASSHTSVHRVHALQLAAEADAFNARDEQLANALRERAAALARAPIPEPPGTLQASLRPYQREGFQFLAHLSTHGFGGVLADDMGLGKTVQTLAWLLHLAEKNAAGAETTHPSQEGNQAHAGEGSSPLSRGVPAGRGVSKRPDVPSDPHKRTTEPRPFRALVVCPKSVVHGWLSEAARFAPSLPALAFTPALTSTPPASLDAPLLVAHYTQLRLNASWFQDYTWDAVVLDEAQFIKNPSSQVAAVARALPAVHRLALTGTPVENRLLDLWSLLAFAQPGLLGTQAAFKRQHSDDDPAALARLRRRVRHFMLRRTKAQVATDLPPRTEDDLVVDLDGTQRRLYDAELKRARAQLLGVETDRALDRVRFNILSSLLRLRQICCHPALVDEAHRELPSAKLDALLEHVEELRDEGHQVLVFSQFVEMLELIREKLVIAGVGHLMLTGATENRAELVDTFQSDRSKTVFLLSLKAAGFGLNLTAASYAILYDPWWNPAVEAQAIDRTHRIGQTQPVVAYRLLAADTVEEKIRALQREKAALAGSIVQEESLAQVLDLDSLKRILG